MKPFVVVISGAPGSGKTTLGWELSRFLHVPLLSRDDIKTGFHITQISTDPGEVWRFAEQAFELFYDSAATYLRAGVSVVVEAAFHSGRSETSLEVLAELGSLIHLSMTTPSAIALSRYRARAEAGQRHPVHNDLDFADQMESGSKDVSVYRMQLSAPHLDVDASNSWDPGISDIADFVTANR